ncbi:MAG: PTS sugar transporter subunit IIA [Planctomycetes bacterium]|nr:PTS sugar transporter subunit IIA [Planctomycetota bacterium]
MTDTNADLDLPSTASLLDLPERTLRRWAENGAVPSRGSNGSLRFQRNDVIEWARSMGMRVQGSVHDNHGKHEPNALAGALRRGALVDDLVGRDAYSAIEDLVRHMPALSEFGVANIDSDTLLARLIAREQLASTAIGHGFAVPHCRSPLGVELGQSIVVLGRLRSSVDWHSIDGAPVDTMILVLSNRLEIQLELLRRIALTLRVPEVRQLVRSSRDLTSICDAIEAVRE